MPFAVKKNVSASVRYKFLAQAATTSSPASFLFPPHEASWASYGKKRRDPGNEAEADKDQMDGGGTRHFEKTIFLHRSKFISNLVTEWFSFLGRVVQNVYSAIHLITQDLDQLNDLQFPQKIKDIL